MALPFAGPGRIIVVLMANERHATWGGRFSEAPAELMLRFGESVSFDRRLAAYDLRVNKAHSAMLHRIGVLTEEERDAIHAGLDRVARRIEAGEMAWDIGFEDVHMNVEQALTREVPAAAKLHTARSRNDQIATDMRLYFKDACAEVLARLDALLKVLLELAERTRDVFVPGYTHLQRAQPVLMAHHWLAYAEMFDRDRRRFRAVADAANICPLGSGALAGSTLPLDREFVAEALGFVDESGRPRVTANSMDAIADRDLFLDFAQACAVCGTHFSRVAEDMILWSSREFGFIELPDAFCTGSSLMPQKKNPDAMELLRGKAARLQGNLQTLFTLVKGLPLTYNRDLQEDKPPVFDSADQTLICLEVLAGTLAGAEVREAVCRRAAEDPLLLVTDVVDYLVRKGVPFREAHHLAGSLVRLAEENKAPVNRLPFDQVKALHEAFDEDWTDVFDLERAMAGRTAEGMPGRQPVDAALSEWRRKLTGSQATGD